jgi:Cytochrome P460
MSKRFVLLFATSVYVGIVALTACKKDETSTPAPVDPDKALFAEATATTGFTFYRSGDTIVAAVPASPHLKYRLRFNAIAATSLDAMGNLPVGRTFPVGSLVIKDVYDRGRLARINVMKKDLTGSNAASGWQWAEYNPDGSIRMGVTTKGAGCLSCHSITPNRDLTRTFDLH